MPGTIPGIPVSVCMLQSIACSTRRSREEAPTLTVRLPVAFAQAPSFVDQYCNCRGSTCSVTFFASPAAK